MNFIGEYQVPDYVSDKIIDWFDYHKKYAGPGTLGSDHRIDKNHKDSIDLGIDPKKIDDVLSPYTDFLYSFLDEYIDEFVKLDKENYGPLPKITDGTNIQWYPKGGGFKVWHTERSNPPTSHRELVFMTYLTDTPNGGTEFINYDYKSECVKGKTLIWPAGFTHVHRGIISDTHEKMIITGWLNFN